MIGAGLVVRLDRTGTLLFFALALGVPAPSARAQEAGAGARAEGELSPREQEARQLFEAGRIAFNDGRFEDALGYFERSHDMSGRPELLFNIGSAADRLRQNERALEAFEQYLEELPEASNRREVEGRVRVLRRAVAPTPAETAAAAQPDPTVSGPATGVGAEEDGGSILSEWWLWTIVGVVAAGAVVAAILLAGGGGGGQEGLLLGDDGVVHYTLGSR